jgi:DNA mismatch repair protein MSH6
LLPSHAQSASLAEVDCLIGLASSRASLGRSCRPQFVSSARAMLRATGLRHPCVGESCVGSHCGDHRHTATFVDNDVVLGGDAAAVVLLTGPNMGGKSTLLRQVRAVIRRCSRQTCIAVIMAQLGSHVAADEFVLSPVGGMPDRC